MWIEQTVDGVRAEKLEGKVSRCENSVWPATAKRSIKTRCHECLRERCVVLIDAQHTNDVRLGWGAGRSVVASGKNERDDGRQEEEEAETSMHQAVVGWTCVSVVIPETTSLKLSVEGSCLKGTRNCPT